MELKIVLSSSGLDDNMSAVIAWKVGIKDLDVLITKIPSFH